MAGKTTYLTTSEFTDRGIFDSSKLECTIDNVCFRKGDSLSNIQIKEALDICKKYNGFNINTLIIKDRETLIVWIEEKSKSNETETVEPEVKAGNEQSLPTKKVTKRYRGQVYEETVVDWSAVKQSSQQNNSARKKYRGQYID